MKRPLHVSASLVVLSAGLLAAPIARAQMSPDLVMETYNANMSAITSAAISNANLNNILDGSARPNSKKGIVVGRPGSSASRGSATATPRNTMAASATSAGLPYTVTPALKASTVQGYIDRLKTKNPAASQAVATNFGLGKYDYGTIYQGIVKGNGLRQNDAVDAMTAYMILGWMIVHNVQDGNAVTPAMVQGARAQFAPRLSQSPQLTAPGAAGQLGEEMKLQVVIVQGGWQSAIKENALPAYQQGIAALFKNQYGLDFSQLTLTGQGFAKK
ncbi:hypothetical protein GCM10027422_40390 [Hymenobacter arcticus]